MCRVFLDANIILDLIDENRNALEKTRASVATLLQRGDIMMTSCDIFTAVYYVAQKRVAREVLLGELEKMLAFIEIIPIDFTMIQYAIELNKNALEEDFEDILQYTCAKTAACELIVTNDKNFFKRDIEVRSAGE
jgi:predicted nucleic acid-binding protein